MRLIKPASLVLLLSVLSLLLISCGGSSDDSSTSEDSVFKDEMEAVYRGAEEVASEHGGYFTSPKFTPEDLAKGIEVKESQLKPVRVVQTKEEATGPGVCIIVSGTDGKNLYASDCDGSFVTVTEGGKPVYSGSGN